jgi:hypothetical protein
VADGVDPAVGNPEGGASPTTFTFKVVYRDLSGKAPLAKRLIIEKRTGTNWSAYKNLPTAKESGDIVSGAVYSCSTRLADESLRYRFAFKSWDGAAVTGSPSEWSSGPGLVGKPKLRWTGTTGYEADGVSPDTGGTTTQFRFRVLYLDSEGDAPTRCNLRLRKNGVLLAAKAMNPWTTGNHQEGKVYEKLMTFASPCTLEYRFDFEDHDGYASGPPTKWLPGPTVGDGTAGGGVTALAAVPTVGGAQVTFSLASSANVTATVLNLAGRPVRALCSDRACTTGANILLWNAQSDAGLRVPSGTYLMRVTARSATGAESSALTTVVVR